MMVTVTTYEYSCNKMYFCWQILKSCMLQMIAYDCCIGI